MSHDVLTHPAEGGKEARAAVGRERVRSVGRSGIVAELEGARRWEAGVALSCPLARAGFTSSSERVLGVGQLRKAPGIRSTAGWADEGERRSSGHGRFAEVECGRKGGYAVQIENKGLCRKAVGVGLGPFFPCAYVCSRSSDAPQ